MLRFGAVGIVATLIHYGVYLLLQKAINENVAFAIGYFVSFVFNYLMSAWFTFRKNTSVKNGVGFGLAHVFNLVLQLCLLNLFLWVGVSRELAPLPVYCIAVPVNFLVVRFVFKNLK